MGEPLNIESSQNEKMGKYVTVFPKLARAIEVAAKTGVPDPEMNSALRQLF